MRKYLYHNIHRNCGRAFCLVVVLIINQGIVVENMYGQQTHQKPDLKFERIYEGLLSNNTTSIFQDHLGYIWVGTNSGLNRFDGTNFQYYQRSDSPNSIAENYIGDIYEDKNHNLWVGTPNYINLYNRETNDFTRYSLPKNFVPNDDSINLVYTILEDEQGTLWASGGPDGLYYFDDYKNEFISYEHLITWEIYNIAAGEGHTLWLTTTGHGLHKLNTATGEIEIFEHDPEDIHSISSNDVRQIEKDLYGNLWIGTRNYGVDRMVIENGKTTFQNYIHEPENPNSLGNNEVYTFHADKDSLFWVGNDNGGLHLYSRELDQFYRYDSDPYDPYSLSHNSISSIYKDNSGRLWVGTGLTGLNVYDPYALKFEHYHKSQVLESRLNNDIIREFYEDNDGIIWIATDGGGLNYFDRENRTFSAFLHDPENPNSINSNAVLSLNTDPDGNLWAGTWGGGLQILNDPVKGEFINFNEKFNYHEQPLRHVFDVHFDKEFDFIWIATFGEGILRFNQNNGEIKRFTTDSEDPQSLSSNHIMRIIEDSRNNIWIATLRGLNKLTSENKETGIFKRYLPEGENPDGLQSNAVRQVIEDRNQAIWIATDNGLSKYLWDSESFITYNQSDGLPANEIRSIVEDDNGYLWIGTINGLSQFDPENETFRNYNRKDGLQSNEFSRYCSLKLRNGEIIIGGHNGFNIFHPEMISDNKYPPPVFLTDFKLFNETVRLDDPNSPLSKHISITDTLSLSHDQNIFTFEFIALNYTKPDQNQYAYMMEGFENVWNYVGNQRNATYTNLNPGTYTFRVKASNNDGIWNEEGISLLVIISPPFWKTTWFYIVIFLFLTAIIVGGYYFRVNNIKKQNRLLGKMVEERTAEIKHANKELKKHIAEKDKLFSIIGHDLRNPFATIIGYLDMLKYEFEEKENKEHLDFLNQLINSTENTHSLLENLLQWSGSKTGGLEPDIQVIDLNSCVDETIRTLESQAGFKKITLEKLVDDSIYALGDRNMVLTILRNLVSNGIKFSTSGSKIRICIKDTGSKIITSVYDEGVGIDDDDLENLFTSDNLHLKTGTQGEKGSGLGLILCKEFLEKIDGELWAENAEEGGSIFSFSLQKPAADKISAEDYQSPTYSRSG